MGVRWLLAWRSQAGAASAADEEVLMSVIESLGCKPAKEKGTKMEVKCHLLKQSSNLSGQGLRDMWLVQTTDASGTCFLIDRHHHNVMEADNGMLTLVEKKLEYRIKTCVTLMGRRFTKGDFGLRVCTATSSVTGAAGGGALLGHILEIEYAPLADPAIASPMMSAFVDLLRAQIPIAPNGLPVGSLERCKEQLDKFPALPANFSNVHNAVLYVDLSMHFLVERSQKLIEASRQQAAAAAAAAGGTAAAAAAGVPGSTGGTPALPPATATPQGGGNNVIKIKVPTSMQQPT